MGIHCRRVRGELRVEFDGPANVVHVSEAHEALLGALSKDRAVRVDLTGATVLDAAFLQLLVSAEASFRDRGLGFEVLDPQGIGVAARVFPGVSSE